MQSHTGTHLDAPAHILPEGKSLSDFDAGFLWAWVGFPLSHQEEMNSKTLEKQGTYCSGRFYPTAYPMG